MLVRQCKVSPSARKTAEWGEKKMVIFLLPFVNTRDQMEGPLRNIEEPLRKLQKTINGNSLEKSKGIFDIVPSKTTIWNHSEMYKSWTKTASTFNLQLYTSENRKQNPWISRSPDLHPKSFNLKPCTSQRNLSFLIPFFFSLSFFFSKLIEFVQSLFRCINLPEQILQNPSNNHFFFYSDFLL